MSRILLTSRRFAPLFWCQFFSAFNDNFLKNALVFLILFGMNAAAGGALITTAGAIFIAPFFFLSGLGGQLADRYDKALVARRLKFCEIAAAGLAVIGFMSHSIPLLFLALFSFGVIAALFGPIKYGILPDHLHRDELPSGNALVESATFLAILLGTIAGGMAPQSGEGWLFALLIMAFAFLCWAASSFIPRTGEAAPNLKIDWNIARSSIDLLREIVADRRLLWGGLVLSWFWAVGAVVLSLLGPIVKDVLGGGQPVVTLFLSIFAIGIAIGSGCASWLCSGRIILLPTAIGGVLIGLFALDFAWASHGVSAQLADAGLIAVFATSCSWHAAIDMFGLAVAGGLFVVPTFAAVQSWAAADRRARVVAAVGQLNAAFMVAASVIVALVQNAGASVATIFGGLGFVSLVVAAAVIKTLPTSALADLVSIIFRAFFRLEVEGAENIDKAGKPCIVSLTHVSFLDAALALGVFGSNVVFAIDYTIAKRWWVRPFLRFIPALPLDPTKPLAVRTLINAVKNGKTVVIFPEGRLTVTGSLMKVYDGTGLVADKTGASILPVRHEGLEATFFARLSREQVRRRWFPKVRMNILEPVKLDIDPQLRGKYRRQAAGTALYNIMSDLVFRTTSTDRTLIEAVVAAARIHGRRRIAVEDPVTGALTYRRLLVGARVLARKFTALAPEGAAIGLMLPNANAAAAAFLGIVSAGRVPAMINFTAGANNILDACRAAKVDMIVSSRAFVEKARLTSLVALIDKDVHVVYLEDIRTTVGFVDKLRGLIGAVRPLVARAPDDPAAILFTSGSEGSPKGVVLSHRNILTNAAQAKARIDFGRTDKVFNVLPVFHSFGLTAGLILPLVSGVRVYLYPSPLHYRTIPELVYGSNATILFGTDTFLAGYARSAHAYDFRSVRFVLAGAERVKETTRRIYMDKFGLRILEGYGVTETAPVLALNTPMYNKSGTVGRLLPGITARLEEVPGIADGGRLYVKGPNVMLGYLRAEKPGVLEAPVAGWHDTGDIVAIDAQGFVTIKDRAKRFAKIGGDMVSLTAVEALASELWPDARSVAVTVPDARKGERIILATENPQAERRDLQAHAKAKAAADLMIPSEIMLLDKIPLLGSGKTDFAGATQFVRQKFEERVEVA